MSPHDPNCQCTETSGTVLATRYVPGFLVFESHYPRGLELSRHFHEHAYLSYVLRGPYSESYNGSDSVICQAGVLRYLPAAQHHANVFRDGSHCLIVEVEDEALKRVGEHSKALERPGEIPGIASEWLARRLYREFRHGDALALLSIEGILLETLAEGARGAGAAGSPAHPRWLRLARDYMEANCLRSISLADIAGAAGVHRVHLSREFRRYYSTTVGEYLRRRRIEHACRLAASSDMPLAQIAVKCGFADASHFSATFRRQMGTTPARYRQMASELS